MSGQPQPLNVTIDDTSPLVKYTPPSTTPNDSANGWAGLVDIPAGGWRADEHSAHMTGMDGAKFALSFWGSGITLYGNVTSGMGMNITVDGTAHSATPGSGSDGQTLADLQSLGAGRHTITLVATRGAPGSTLTFDRAVVNIGDAWNFTKKVVDASDFNAITYGGPNSRASWGFYNLYNGTIVPEGVNNQTYQAANIQGATFYYQFSGTAFFYYGPCYRDTHGYTVQFDGNANSQPEIFNASVPYTPVAEGCLRYYTAGLSKDQHSILVTNMEQAWCTNNWLEVWSYDLQDTGGSNSTSPNNAYSLAPFTSTAYLLFIGLYYFLHWL